MTPQLARLAAIGGFRGWDRMVGRFITDERLRRIFTFQALYAGVPPQQALAAYAVIAYMDTIAGVYFPKCGMRAVPEGMAAAATDAGVQFRYGSTVTRLERSGSRVTAVCTDSGDWIACDAVVLTTELPPDLRVARPHTPSPDQIPALPVMRGGPRRRALGSGCAATPQHQFWCQLVEDFR